MKHKIRIVLRNGYDFTFLCDEFKVKTIDAELSGYSFTGAAPTVPMFINLSDVLAIIDEGEVKEADQNGNYD